LRRLAARLLAIAGAASPASGCDSDGEFAQPVR
jgi:hypothetical protein